jgi:hypothetical protein
MPDKSKVMTQTKRGTLVLQVAGFGVGLTTPPHKNVLLGCFYKKKKRLTSTKDCNVRRKRREIKP